MEVQSVESEVESNLIFIVAPVSVNAKGDATIVSVGLIAKICANIIALSLAGRYTTSSHPDGSVIN